MKTDPTPLLLRNLGLTSIARDHEDLLARAESENWGYRRFLRHLAEIEVQEKLTRRTERLLADSQLPAAKTLANLDQSRLPDKIRRQLPTLLDGEFIRRGDNLICYGLPGRGKTHCLAAIARELIQRHQLPILFIPTYKLVAQLLEAKRDCQLPALLKRLERYAAIAIDDLGYVQQSRDEMEVLFTFLAERYEKKSVLLTTNLAFSKWDQIFKDPMTTMAAVDRLVHHAIILEFTGESQRATDAKAKAKPEDPTPPIP